MPSSSSHRLGFAAESRFITECLERDFEPHHPFTPMPWDFIVSCPAGDLKVQVKSTAVKQKEGFYNIITSSGHTNKEVMSREIDIVACYASPIETWWIIPRGVINGKTVKLYDNKSSRSIYKGYQENWMSFY
jgi:hypothetical protein